MRTGFCESCENFSPFLKRVEGQWLCLKCRGEIETMNRMLVNEERPVFFI